MQRKAVSGPGVVCDFCGHNLRGGDTVFVEGIEGRDENTQRGRITRCEDCEQAQLEGSLEDYLRGITAGTVLAGRNAKLTVDGVEVPMQSGLTMGGEALATEQEATTLDEDTARAQVGLPPVGGRLSPQHESTPEAPVEQEPEPLPERQLKLRRLKGAARVDVTVTLELGADALEVQDEAEAIMSDGMSALEMKARIANLDGVERVSMVVGAGGVVGPVRGGTGLSHGSSATKADGVVSGGESVRTASGGTPGDAGGAPHGGDDKALERPPVGREHVKPTKQTTVDAMAIGPQGGKIPEGWERWKAGVRVAVRHPVWERFAAECDSREPGTPYPADSEARAHARVAEKTQRAIRASLRAPGAEPVPPLGTLVQARFGTVQEAPRQSDSYVQVVMDWGGPGGALALRVHPSWLMRWDGPVPAQPPVEGEGDQGGLENDPSLRYSLPDESFAARRRRRKAERLLSRGSSDT